MGITLKNNAHTTLAANMSSTDTNISVSDVSSFPTLDVGDYFYCTIESTTGAYEIVKVTQINASSFDVVRGQEDTIAVPFNIGARVALNMTVQNLEDFFVSGSNVDDTAFGPSWNGNTEDAPSLNTVYDKIISVEADYAAADTAAVAAHVALTDPHTQYLKEADFSSTVAPFISDTAYDATSWDGVTTIAPSKNAVRDKFATVDAAITAAVSDTAYAGSWDGVTTVAPSKNAVYDKFVTVDAAITAAISDTAYNATSWDSVTTVAPSKNAVRDKFVTVDADIATRATDSLVVHLSGTETITGAKTITAIDASSPRAKGDGASWQVMNNAATKNGYMGIDSTGNLLFGFGYGPNQGITPRIIIKDTDNVVQIGATTDCPTGALSVLAVNDWSFWTRRTGSGAESLWRNEHYCATPHPYLAFLASRGSYSSPTAVQANDLIGGIGGRIYDASGTTYAEYRTSMTDDVVAIQFKANQNATGSAHGTRIEQYTTTDGATTPTLRTTLSNAGELMIGTSTSGGGLFTVKYAIDAIPGASAGLGAINVADQLSGGPSIRYQNETSNGWARLAGTTTSWMQGGSEQWRITTTSFRPASDNAKSIGEASFRASVIYAGTGTINTSDAREKTPLQPLTAGVKRAVRKIMSGVGVYQWLASVAEKGDKARLHVGVTAQSVEEAFLAEKEDPNKWALFCKDEVFEEVIEDVTSPEMVVEDIEIDGKAFPTEVERDVTRQKRTMQSKGYRLGLRHDQLMYLAMAVLFDTE